MNREELEIALSENYYFTQSEKQWVYDALLEMLQGGAATLESVLPKTLLNNKKMNAKALIDRVKNEVAPIEMETMTAINNLKKRLKTSGLTLDIPQHLEGDSVTLTMKLVSSSDVLRLGNFLKQKETLFLELMALFSDEKEGLE